MAAGPKRPEYEPKTIDQKLGYLVEECGEVLAAVGKTLRWGPASTNPEIDPADRETNAEWVLRELADLEQAMARVRKSLTPVVRQAPAPAAPLSELQAEVERLRARLDAMELEAARLRGIAIAVTRDRDAAEIACRVSVEGTEDGAFDGKDERRAHNMAAAVVARADARKGGG